LPELRSVLRDGAFEAVIETASLAESYARSLGEAAYRGDQTTVHSHIWQLRACCLALIGIYKDHLDGQGMAEADRPSHGDRQDQRSGDGVA
jgi:hypothetical protein